MKRGKTIGGPTAGLMIGLALLLDLAGAVADFLLFFFPIFGVLISSTGWLGFSLWFLLQGISPFSLRRLSAFGGGFVLELFPFLNLLPGLTVAVAGAILVINWENRR